MLATEIIKQLLEAQDLDPMEHFIKEDEKEDGDGTSLRNKMLGYHS